MNNGGGELLVRTTRPGKCTGAFGKWLTDYLKGIQKYQDYAVYYDHGDPTSSSNVVAIKGIYGEAVSLRNQLAQVDVLVAKPNREILTIVEIEEGASSPKKIIGDVFALLMCNQFSVRQQGKHVYFKITPETRMIIVGKINPSGYKREQLETIILPRVRILNASDYAIDPGNINFIFTETVDEAISDLKVTFINRFQ